MYLRPISISNIPASGAISVIEPNCLILSELVGVLPTLMSPMLFADGPPAKPSMIVSAPLITDIFTGPVFEVPATA